MKRFYAICALMLLHTNLSLCLKNLNLFAEWKTLDFAFPSPAERQDAIDKGLFQAGVAIPIDVDVDYRDPPHESRYFVTMPRFTTGIPVTLGYISGQSTLIRPYPSYSWQSSQGQNCDEITSVFRVAIDKCRRLWVLDDGRVGGQKQNCPPQLLVFDLDTDVLVHRYRFPENQFISNVSNFIQPVLDIQDLPPHGKCLRTKVYIADVSGFSILVYDLESNQSWMVKNKLFIPEADYGTHTVAGQSFVLMDGIFSMALTPDHHQHHRHHFHHHHHERYLYFHALASLSENRVSLKLLNNATIWNENAESHSTEFHQIGIRQSQATTQAMYKNGILFFGLENPSAIACWDSTKPYTSDYIDIVAQNEQTLQFPSGVKIIKNAHGIDELWVVSCSYQKAATGTMNPNEINFRIQKLAVDELLEGCKC